MGAAYASLCVWTLLLLFSVEADDEFGQLVEDPLSTGGKRFVDTFDREGQPDSKKWTVRDPCWENDDSTGGNVRDAIDIEDGKLCISILTCNTNHEGIDPSGTVTSIQTFGLRHANLLVRAMVPDIDGGRPTIELYSKRYSIALQMTANTVKMYVGPRHKQFDRSAIERVTSVPFNLTTAYHDYRMRFEPGRSALVFTVDSLDFVWPVSGELLAEIEQVTWQLVISLQADSSVAPGDVAGHGNDNPDYILQPASADDGQDRKAFLIDLVQIQEAAPEAPPWPVLLILTVVPSVVVALFISAYLAMVRLGGRVCLRRFLVSLLDRPPGPQGPCIQWTQRGNGIFEILDEDEIAKQWRSQNINRHRTDKDLRNSTDDFKRVLRSLSSRGGSRYKLTQEEAAMYGLPSERNFYRFPPETEPDSGNALNNGAGHNIYTVYGPELCAAAGDPTANNHLTTGGFVYPKGPPIQRGQPGPSNHGHQLYAIPKRGVPTQCNSSVLQPPVVIRREPTGYYYSRGHIPDATVIGLVPQSVLCTAQPLSGHQQSYQQQNAIFSQPWDSSSSRDPSEEYPDSGAAGGRCLAELIIHLTKPAFGAPSQDQSATDNSPDGHSSYQPGPVDNVFTDSGSTGSNFNHDLLHADPCTMQSVAGKAQLIPIPSSSGALNHRQQPYPIPNKRGPPTQSKSLVLEPEVVIRQEPTGYACHSRQVSERGYLSDATDVGLARASEPQPVRPAAVYTAQPLTGYHSEQQNAGINQPWGPSSRKPSDEYEDSQLSSLSAGRCVSELFISLTMPALGRPSGEHQTDQEQFDMDNSRDRVVARHTGYQPGFLAVDNAFTGQGPDDSNPSEDVHPDQGIVRSASADIHPAGDHSSNTEMFVENEFAGTISAVLDLTETQLLEAAYRGRAFH